MLSQVKSTLMIIFFHRLSPEDLKPMKMIQKIELQLKYFTVLQKTHGDNFNYFYKDKVHFGIGI